MFNKKFGKIFLSVFAVCFLLGVGGVITTASAAAASAVGVVDYALLLDNHPDMPKANEELKAELEAAKKEFESKSAGLSDKDKQELDLKLRQRWVSKQRELVSAIMDKVKTAIREVAEARGLSIVVDKTAVLYGGQDITGEVGKKIGAK